VEILTRALVTVFSRNHAHERGGLPSMGAEHLQQAFCLKKACKKGRKPAKKDGEVICQSSMETTKPPSY
jgi:hypothetical protein